MQTIRSIVLALAFAATSLAQASPIMLITDAGGPIHSVDVATGAITNFGSPSVIMTDIAFSPTGVLYGISDDRLYRIDRSGVGTISGTTLIGNMGLGAEPPASLVFGADGTLYTANTSLHSIDVATGQASLIGNGGYGYGSNGFTGDLAFIGGQLYLTSASVDFDAGFSYEDLVRLDTSTGAGTLVGHVGSRSIDTGDVTGFLTVWGLATPDGVNLYGALGTQVISIDPATATGTLLLANYAQPPFTFLAGAMGAAMATESSPVPAPAALWLMGTAIAAALVRARRRRAA